jgi:hypothetical protein
MGLLPLDVAEPRLVVLLQLGAMFKTPKAPRAAWCRGAGQVALGRRHVGGVLPVSRVPGCVCSFVPADACGFCTSFHEPLSYFCQPQPQPPLSHAGLPPRNS